MSKCDAYFTCSQRDLKGETYEQGHCSASKWSVECRCDGDTDNCTFYPEKRRSIMNTAEMWLKAQEDGKTYCFGAMFYNKEKGFVDVANDPWPLYAFDNYEDFMTLNGWLRLPEIPTMTRAEAESKLGVKIID